jgi:hypothetical protein
MRTPDKLPDPWHYDSEALLRDLGKIRELVLNISINKPNETHSDINKAVSALWNLEEQLRYLLHLHRERQRSWRRKHADAPKREARQTTVQPHVIRTIKA